MAIFEVQGPDGKTYEVDAPDAATAAQAFTKHAASFDSPEARAMTANNARMQQSGDEDYAQQELANKARGAKNAEYGVVEGAKQLWGGIKQLGAGLQDDYAMLVHGKANRKEEQVRDASGKLVARNTEYLDSSKEAQATATEMLRQAVSTQEDMDKGVDIPARNTAAGATQLAAATMLPEAALPRAVTASGAILKNSAMGAMGSGLMFDGGDSHNDALIAAGIAPVLGLIPSLAPAIKNMVGRGLQKAATEGRSLARAASARMTLGKDFGFSLAQETGIPELVSLERSAYNSKMVNYFADQTDKFVKKSVDVLRQPIKEGQTLENDFVSARAQASKNLKDFQLAASNNYEEGIKDARRIANENSGGARIPVPNFQQQIEDTFAKVRGLKDRGVASQVFTKRFMDHTEGLFTGNGGDKINYLKADQLADVLVDLTTLQKSDNKLTRKFAGELRAKLEPDLDNLEGKATFEADDSVKTILETRKEYKRAQQLIGELGDSQAYKLLGVGEKDTDPGAVLQKLKSFSSDKQASIRSFLEENSPDLLVSLKDAAIKEAQKHAATIRAAADSQNDLGQMMDAMFDSKKGFDLRTQGIWNADELRKMEGIKDGLRTIANNRPAVGGAGTTIQPADIAPNLISRSEIFIARQAARIFTGTKMADFFTDPEIYKYLTKINRTTTGSPFNIAARAALLDRMQTDYAEQQEDKK